MKQENEEVELTKNFKELLEKNKNLMVSCKFKRKFTKRVKKDKKKNTKRRKQRKKRIDKA